MYFSKAALRSANSSCNFSTEELRFEQVAAITKQSNYSNILWKGGARKADNFLAAHSIILDFDATMPLAEAKEAFKDTQDVCIVTSKSHQSPCKIEPDGRESDKVITPADYFHVIIGLIEPITDLEIYKSAMEGLIKLYGSDKSCKDGGRFYFGNPRQEAWYS